MVVFDCGDVTTDAGSLLLREVLRTVEREVKGRALIHRSPSPDAPSMPMDDTLYGGQPDAGSFEFPGAVQALERAE